MADRHVEFSKIGFLALLIQAIVLVPTGALLFVTSFGVLFKNEGRPHFGREARSAQVASTGNTSLDGFVSVTGNLGANEQVGDAEFVAPDDFVVLFRVVEMYAWTEQISERSRRRFGGGRDVETEYVYQTVWTDLPESSLGFRYPEGHTNPPMTMFSTVNTAARATLGEWSFDAGMALFLAGEPLALDDAELIGRGREGQRVEDSLYYGSGSVDAPEVGDYRVRFVVVRTGQQVTAFGDARDGELHRHSWRGVFDLMPVFPGDRDNAVALLDLEYAVRGWVFRIGGIVLMWLGLFMLTGPIHSVCDVLPPLGMLTRIVFGGLLVIPVAILSFLTIAVATILHSPLLILLFSFVIWYALRVVAERRRERREAEAAAGIRDSWAH